VFINSLGTDYRIWHKVAHALRGEEFRFLFHDKRGHGLSDVGDVPYEMADHVNDVAALMDHYGMKDAIICGISVGGMIALGLSAARPDLVAGLVLCNTAHKIGTTAAWNLRIAKVANTGLSHIWGQIEQAWFTEAYRRANADEVRGIRNMVIRCPVGGYIGTCMAIRDTDYTEAARSVSVPTLVVASAQDGSTPPDVVKGMADIIPGAQYHEMPDAAHMTCLEQPTKLAGLIRDFATKHQLI
jgi:3-oxoadipate enol-lactonase